MEENGLIAKNRKAYYNYSIIEELEAGIVLKGSEVKSLRKNSCNITDSYADVRFNEKQKPEVWLLNLNISEYKNAGALNHSPLRPRKLLLEKKEINKLIGKLEQKGYTLIPLIIYFNNRGLVKVKMGLGKGKAEYDKRESIKQREWNREKQRQLRD
jgi:SsrA-binding protein